MTLGTPPGLVPDDDGEIEVFYWPHTPRVLNWVATAPAPDPSTTHFVRRDRTGAETDRAALRLP